RARLLQDHGDWDAARAAFAKALELDPELAEAISGLAALVLKAGDAAEARKLADQALAIAPDRTEAVWTLARAALAQRDFGTAERRLRPLVDEPRLSPLARSEIQLALGEALHGLGRPAEAFAAWVAGKAVLRKIYAQRAASRPGETHKAQVL